MIFEEQDIENLIRQNVCNKCPYHFQCEYDKDNWCMTGAIEKEREKYGSER